MRPQRYGIPDELDYETAHKVLSIWQGSAELFVLKATYPWSSHTTRTPAPWREITQRNFELTGMSAEQTYTRVYPNGTSAAHILGYMSKVYDDDWAGTAAGSGLQPRGSGGRDGRGGHHGRGAEQAASVRAEWSQRVEIDSRSSVVRILEQTDATPGNDVILTIDADLQKVVEQGPCPKRAGYLRRAADSIQQPLGILSEKGGKPRRKGHALCQNGGRPSSWTSTPGRCWRWRAIRPTIPTCSPGA